jgi:hypothetical protein
MSPEIDSITLRLRQDVVKRNLGIVLFPQVDWSMILPCVLFRYGRRARVVQEGLYDHEECFKILSGEP